MDQEQPASHTEIYSPPFKAEFELFNAYKDRLKDLFEQECSIRPVSIIENGKENSRAFLIVPGNNLDLSKYSALLFADHDDTQEPYTGRKSHYQNLILQMVPESVRSKIKPVLHALNDACRVLPITGLHPERYSSIFEMIADTHVLNACQNPQHIPQHIQDLIEDPSEKKTRDFLVKNVLPTLPQDWIVFEHDEERDKTYFREATHQALAVRWDNRPTNLVSESVWSHYIKAMTQAVIPTGERSGYDFPSDIAWIPSTFGAADFQLEKLINALEVIKAASGRIPEALLLFTRGRKEPVVNQLIESLPDNIPVLVLDDSPGQLIKYAKNMRLTLIRALRSGSKRANGKTPEGTAVINMDEGGLSQKIKKLLGM